ncbi:hypothetical protein VCRA2121O436_350040 [Vibrio crassostreae]|nr:hypothetical protein VCRA2113O420_340040 [Vibrio crassostreae]CAK3420841.1 hypothetical protein VCRA2121O436_350040 [Vibrio crassostreae]
MVVDLTELFHVMRNLLQTLYCDFINISGKIQCITTPEPTESE